MSEASHLLPYLRLVRAPAIFSALGDPVAGALVAAPAPPAGRAAGAAGAAALLYAAGMALNDYADRAEDARERPGRPIPSGAVPPAAALGTGATLAAAGVLAARAAGALGGGAALAGLVLAYDFGLKHAGPLGPVAMGACRAASLLMGAEAAGGAAGARAARPAALTLGAYVAGLTLLARGETGGARRSAVAGGAAVAAAAVLAAAWLGGRRSAPWAAGVVALAGPAVVRAVRAPAPATTGAAVEALIRAIPALDGALAARRAPGGALALAPLLALVRYGRKLIPIS